MRIAGYILLLLICISIAGRSQVKLAPLFTDNMVLQQKSQAMVWGWTGANKTVSITTSWNARKYSIKADGAGKFQLKVSTPDAGGPFTIRFNDGKETVLKNILIGEVWLCGGQSNMEMPVKGFKGQPIIGSNEAILKSKNKNIRLITVPRSSQFLPQDTIKPASWQEANPESVSNFSATAYFFGKDMNEVLNIPVGLIHISWGGSPVESWMDAASLGAFPDIQLPLRPDSIKVPNRTPTTLFNGMIHPVIGYTVKGFIWYQGESNYDRPDQYEKLFPALVKLWRTKWQSDSLPFYYAQIAPYKYEQLPPNNKGAKFNSAYLRDAQRKSLLKIPLSGMAVLMDLGEENLIHPSHKKEAGERLALLALGKTYGYKGFGIESPLYDTLVISKDVAEVKFKNAANWLTSYGKELAQFEIAGSDKIFYPAKATIYRSSVMVSSPLVKDPVAVRYAFKDFVIGDLFSTEGLPASSFRTDNW